MKCTYRCQVVLRKRKYTKLTSYAENIKRLALAFIDVHGKPVTVALVRLDCDQVKNSYRV